MSLVGIQDPTWLPCRWKSALESGQWAQLLLWPTGEEGHMHDHSLAFLWQEIIMFTLRTERNECGLPKHLSPHKPQYMEATARHTSSMRTEVSVCLVYFINKETRVGAAFTQALQFLQSGFTRACLHPNALPYVRMYLCYIQMPLPLVQSFLISSFNCFSERSKL